MSNRLALPFSRSDLARLPGNLEALLSASFPPGPSRAFGSHPSSLLAFAAAEVEREKIRLDELGFRHLRTSAEIDRIKHLREEIQLPGSALADPGFQTREKKETRWALSAHSQHVTNSSGQSVSCRWD